MLEADAPAEGWVPGVSHVARWVDTRGAGGEVFVGEDPIVDVQPGRLTQFHPGCHSDADDNDVAGYAPSVGQSHLFYMSGSAEGVDPNPEA